MVDYCVRIWAILKNISHTRTTPHSTHGTTNSIWFLNTTLQLFASFYYPPAKKNFSFYCCFSISRLLWPRILVRFTNAAVFKIIFFELKFLFLICLLLPPDDVRSNSTEAHMSAKVMVGSFFFVYFSSMIYYILMIYLGTIHTWLRPYLFCSRLIPKN